MFTKGFEKTALSDKAKAALAIGGLGAYSVGTGALAGHLSHIDKKVIHARAGKDYEPKSFIDRHPKLTGALSLGIAPAASVGSHQQDLDSANPKMRELAKKHPFLLRHLVKKDKKG